MCLDIDPYSVVHRHLINKVTSSIAKDERPVTTWFNYKHNLTMLPSFHISLGAPDDETVLINKYNSDWDEYISFSDIVPIIGDITLAPILISKKNNKKSAWIPLNPHWFDQFAPPSIAKHLNDFDSFDHHCEIYPVQLLHISLANLTGEPRDSIARPEDCIIDTITA